MSHKGAGPYNLTRHLKSAYPLVLAGIQEDRISINNHANVTTPAIPSTSQEELSTAYPDGSTQSEQTTSIPNRRLIVKKNQINEYFSKPLSLKKIEAVNKMLLQTIVKKIFAIFHCRKFF